MEQSLSELYRNEGGEGSDAIASVVSPNAPSSVRQQCLAISKDSYEEFARVLSHAAKHDGGGEWEDRCGLVKAVHSGK